MHCTIILYVKGTVNLVFLHSNITAQMMGFPTGEPYKGTLEQKARLERQFRRKAEFMKAHKCPIWNGEFGPVYSDSRDADAASVNQDRYHMLGEQLAIYDKHQISWSIWLYKDIGI
jgi:hypothetical protein